MTLENIRPRFRLKFPLSFVKGKGVRGKGLTPEKGKDIKKRGEAPLKFLRIDLVSWLLYTGKLGD